MDLSIMNFFEYCMSVSSGAAYGGFAAGRPAGRRHRLTATSGQQHGAQQQTRSLSFIQKAEHRPVNSTNSRVAVWQNLARLYDEREAKGEFTAHELN